ncbi:MAG TPA: SCO family protein [Pyrinomonadaceae bacterium]|jgi:cytochrome oxidase Cu insertion factor (SCO1/SenC/PrrC family)
MNTRLKLTATWACTLLCALLASSQLVAYPHSQAQVTTAAQQKSADKPARTYACPMHPEVKSTKKGKCPKCKMDLQPVRATTSAVEKESMVASVTVGEIMNADGNSSAAGNVPGPRKRLVIPDVEVLDQDGNALHFYTDLIKGKTVAINFIFTNCTTICPPLAATFARVQKEMGDKVGKDVHFISISVDPLTDTPERLKAWGAKFKAGTGWTFVTGSKEEMDKLLDALGASVARREDHTPSVIVGNDSSSVWTRTYGLARPSQMVGLIENVIAGKLDEPPTVKEPAKP